MRSTARYFVVIPAAAFVLLGVTSTPARGQCEISHTGIELAGGLEFVGDPLAVSADGATAVLGMSNNNNNGHANAGAVAILVRSGDAWIEEARLFAPEPAFGDKFGISADISANGITVLVGHFLEDEGGTNAGAAHVFVRRKSGWIRQATVMADDRQADDRFGLTVALSGDGRTALIGALGDDDGGNANAGSAYVYRRNQGVWTQQSKLTSDFSNAGDEFGISLDISGDGNTAIVGAWRSDIDGFGSGAAFSFVRSNGEWSQQSRIVPNDPTPGPAFGFSAALSADGHTAIIGSPGDSGEETFGAVIAFVLEGDSWVEQATITEADTGIEFPLGLTVDVSADGDTAVVGVLRAFTTDSGHALVLRRDGNTWAQSATLVPPVLEDVDGVASRVALTSDGRIGVALGFGDGVSDFLTHFFDLDTPCEIVPAELTDFQLTSGSLIGGTLDNLLESDEAAVRTRSELGFQAFEPNVMEMVVGFKSPFPSPRALNLVIKLRINHTVGLVRVRLHNWETDGFDTVDVHTIGFFPVRRMIPGRDATNRVRAGDDRIELAIKHTVVATFTAAGFDSFFDEVSMEVVN